MGTVFALDVGIADAKIEFNKLVAFVFAVVVDGCTDVEDWAESGPDNAAKRESTVILDVDCGTSGIAVEEIMLGVADTEDGQDGGWSFMNSLSSSERPSGGGEKMSSDEVADSFSLVDSWDWMDLVGLVSTAGSIYKGNPKHSLHDKPLFDLRELLDFRGFGLGGGGFPGPYLNSSG